MNQKDMIDECKVFVDMCMHERVKYLTLGR